jgi:serine/tyrosine/threonine adenylyltransferase
MSENLLNEKDSLPLSTSKFAKLGSVFWQKTVTSPLKNPVLGDLNPLGCALLGLSTDSISEVQWRDLHNGSLLFENQPPICAVYSGHQFGVWAGQLGDGRAHLLGELNGWELQLKGAGLTPFSRMGDGRAVLRSTIREYLASEYLQALGIPTTRSLGLVSGSDSVSRETIETGAMMIRLSPSFVRFGTIEHFYSIGNTTALTEFLEWLNTYFYPECASVKEIFDSIALKTADLMAKWMVYGFCHGVMNTDNMSLLGLTLDYGPYGFLDRYDPDHICNHSDPQGRYSYGNQPGIAQWNLIALAYSLQTHLSFEEAQAFVGSSFSDRYYSQYWSLLCDRFGLQNTKESTHWIQTLLQEFHQQGIDHNRWLYQLTHSPEQLEEKWRPFLVSRKALVDQSRIQKMASLNPKYVLKNWVCQWVIEAAQKGDFTRLKQVRHIMQTPFEAHDEFTFLTGDAPTDAYTVGVSCSS